MKPRARQLSLASKPSAPIAPPPNRGVLWYDFQIPERFFGGLPTIGNKVRWVREHLPRESRVKIGGTSAWYEQDVLAYIERERGRLSA